MSIAPVERQLQGKPYSAYKDSGLPWLGQIPEHWDVAPLKHFAEVNREALGEITSSDYRLAYLDISNVDERGVISEPPEMLFRNAPSRARRVVRPGDTVISTVRTYLKAIAFLEEPQDNLIASTGFAVLSPRHGTLAACLTYVVRNHAFVSDVSAHSVGVSYPAITATDLGKLKVAVTADVDEQRAIVRFLDSKLAEIDQLIEGKRRLIKLLNEQKAVIINRAVTRGIDPNVRLKPSGIEWLGEIPEHWATCRIKYILGEVDSRSETGEEILLSMRMHRGLVPHNDVSDRPIGSRDLVGFKRTQPGSIVMNRMRAASGLFAVTYQPGLVSPDYAVFRQIAEIVPEYYVSLFRSPGMRAIFRSESKGLGTGKSGFLRLYSDCFGCIAVPVPPYHEQADIIRHIADDTSELSSSIERVERQIAVMTEYRTALISDVVTGKVDVRGLLHDQTVSSVSVPFTAESAG